MKITKLGHCCLIIEEKGVKILTDPGEYTTAQNEVNDIDVVLITHEHPDHLYLESLRTVLTNNPNAKIITNRGVAKILSGAGIAHQLLEHGQGITIKKVLIEGFGEKHAEIYPTVLAVVNTGYFIASRFFYPGDALYNPGKPVEIFALPVCGPWLKISEAIDYGKEIHPQVCFPVHDGMLKITGAFHKLPEKELAGAGIRFIVIGDGQSIEL